MKGLLLSIAAASLLSSVCVAAFADSRADVIVGATGAALKKFVAEPHASHDFVGTKAWADGSWIRVKIYVTRSQAVYYSCSFENDGTYDCERTQ